MVGALTVLGGAISGVIGIAYSEYRNRRERHRELKEWYDNRIQAAGRVERLTSDDFDGSTQYMGDALSGVLGRLTGHVMDAPSRADPEVVASAEEFAAKCQDVRKYVRSDSPLDADEAKAQVEPAAIKAKAVRKKAESSRREVGWI
jgi:hypothetical protein